MNPVAGIAAPVAIDWQAPWLAQLHAVAAGLPPDVKAGALDAAGSGTVARALTALGPAPVRFVPQAALPPGAAYEQFIFTQRAVPTRDNLHDLFNGLVWHAFPQAKLRLNQLQAGEIERLGVGATRGPLRDALTLFDENGAVLDAPAPLWQALAARDWQRLFIDQRALWREARLLVFGHALLEKMVQPRKAHTAHVLPAAGARCSIAGTDAAIAAALDSAWLAGKPFMPLPVLGIPGWCSENADVSFYDSPQVFRPRRAPDSTTTRQVLPTRPA